MRPYYVDISMPLDRDLPVWPGSPGIATSATQSIACGDAANVSHLEMDVHSGTHVDAPSHFVRGGETLGDIGLSPFIGSAWVVDLTDEPVLDRRTLERAGIPTRTTRVLLKTRNSLDRSLRRSPFREDYAALTLDAAEWVAAQGMALVGIDYLSIQRFEDPPDTHRVLLGARVAILEGLDLAEVRPGAWELVCLPIHLPGSEAAPARAVLFEPEAHGG